jgi:hypothetical protein
MITSATWYVPTAVYRAYGRMASLLYVGISNRPEARMQAHKHSAEWAFEFSHATCEWFDDRFFAAGAETQAIRAEHPVYNVTDALCHCGRTNLCIICAYSGPQWHRGLDRWANWADPIPHICPATIMYGPGSETRIFQMKYIKPTIDDPWPYDLCSADRLPPRQVRPRPRACPCFGW